MHTSRRVHTDECLKSAKSLIKDRILRLINKVEPVVSEAVLDKTFNVELPLKEFFHLVVESCDLFLTGLHGVVHRYVRMLHNGIGIVGIAGQFRNTGKGCQITV